MIRPPRAENVLGRIDRGVHLLQKGIAIGQGVYQIGRTLAPLAAGTAATPDTAFSIATELGSFSRS